MDTVKLQNASTHVKVLVWTESQQAENSLCPPNWDPVRGDHGPSLVQRQVAIPVGDLVEVPADIWAVLLAPDRIVAAWIAAGELIVEP